VPFFYCHLSKIIDGAPKIFSDENQGFIDILGEKFLFNLKKN
jgi:hypothetical protein